jgi:putative membrane protein
MFHYYGNPWGMGFMGGFGFPIGGFLSWIFFILAFVLIIRLFRGGHHDDHGEPPEKSALEILKDRYARGEITKKEFLEMKKDIE